MSNLREGTCPKCDSEEVYRNPDEFDIIRDFAKKSGFVDRQAELITFICGACGYAENYVKDQTELQKIRDYWQRVPKSKKKNDQR